MREKRDKPTGDAIPDEQTISLEELLDAIEDELDVPLVKERLAEMEKDGGIPLEQLKRELGLTGDPPPTTRHETRRHQRHTRQHRRVEQGNPVL